MGDGVIALDCQRPLKKRHGLRRFHGHRQEDIGKGAQNEVISVQIFRPLVFDTLDLGFAQAGFDRADDV